MRMGIIGLKNLNNDKCHVHLVRLGTKNERNYFLYLKYGKHN